MYVITLNVIKGYQFLASSLVFYQVKPTNETEPYDIGMAEI